MTIKEAVKLKVGDVISVTDQGATEHATICGKDDGALAFAISFKDSLGRPRTRHGIVKLK